MRAADITSSIGSASTSGDLPSVPLDDDLRSRRSTVTSGEPRLSSLDITLEDRLGSGSYGTVFRASTTHHGIVAVKVLPWGPNDVSAELKHELKLLQRCSSPHVVRAFGAFSKPQELWIVMEFCPHGSLLDVLRTIDRPFTEGQRALVCRDALRGLQYMHTHRKGIIHRDVKCANLLLADGIVKLADFGVAVQLNSTASKRSSIIGTPHWMAPEVVQNGKYDARADVWSLGITAIEMSQGAPPHADVRPVLRVMFAIAAQPSPTLAEPEAASPLFNDFLAKLLTKDASARPSSSAMLEHPFVAGEDGAGLDPNAGGGLHGLVTAVAEAVAYRLANPPAEPEADASSGTIRLGGTTCGGTLVRRSSGAVEGVDGGTFVMRASAEQSDGDGAYGTFVQHGTVKSADALQTPLPWMTAAPAAQIGRPSPRDQVGMPTMGPAVSASQPNASMSPAQLRVGPPPPLPPHGSLPATLRSPSQNGVPPSNAAAPIPNGGGSCSSTLESGISGSSGTTTSHASGARSRAVSQASDSTAATYSSARENELVESTDAPLGFPFSPQTPMTDDVPSPDLAAFPSPAAITGSIAPPGSLLEPHATVSVDDADVLSMRRADHLATRRIPRSASDDALYEHTAPKARPIGPLRAVSDFPQGNMSAEASAQRRKQLGLDQASLEEGHCLIS